jgi:hypothetical protein
MQRCVNWQQWQRPGAAEAYRPGHRSRHISASPATN